MDLKFQQNPYPLFKFYRLMDYEKHQKSLYNYLCQISNMTSVLKWVRKLSKVRYTYYLALPPDWVRDKVRNGRVEITLEEDGNLKIKPVE